MDLSHRDMLYSFPAPLWGWSFKLNTGLGGLLSRYAQFNHLYNLLDNLADTHLFPGFNIHLKQTGCIVNTHS